MKQILANDKIAAYFQTLDLDVQEAGGPQTRMTRALHREVQTRGLWLLSH